MPAGVASVWYIGSSTTRRISSADWTAAGITGSPADSQWDSSNGWSIDANNFTAPQLALLALLTEFNTAGTPFGPRPGSAVVPQSPDQTVVTRAFLQTYAIPLPATPAVAGENYGKNEAGLTIPHAAELGIAMDDKGGTTQAITFATAIAGVPALVVFASPREVYLEWGGRFNVTVAGNGNMALCPYEVTSGALVACGAPLKGIVGGFLHGTYSQLVDIPRGEFRLGPVLTTRVFKLTASVFADAAGLVAVTAGGADNADKPFLRAVAR